MIFVKPAKWDSCTWDNFRWDVYTPYFDSLKATFEKVDNSSINVTRRALSLGARDTVTRWREKSFTESTVDMVIVDRNSTHMPLPVGTFVRLDALGFTCDGFILGDEVYHPRSTKYYEVLGIRERWRGDSFQFREVDLTEMPLHV